MKQFYKTRPSSIPLETLENPSMLPLMKKQQDMMQLKLKF